MPVGKDAAVTLGWCDNGHVDGKFAEGLMAAVLSGAENGTPICESIRVHGNQIGRQRQGLFDHWADKSRSEWLLWVDSDVMLNLAALKKLWAAADADRRPVVSGVYFISKGEEAGLLRPYPSLFEDVSEFELRYLHPLPEDQVLRADVAGFGFVLMHRSVVPVLRAAHPGKSLFAETGDGVDDHFMGEDVVFFRRLKAAGVPLHAHTGAVVKHVKRFGLDRAYYELYWSHPSTATAPRPV